MNVYSESFLTPEAWTRDAACAEVGGNTWFPEPQDESTARDAKRICRSCPVADECLEYALRTRPQHGIWATYSAKSLQRLRKERS